MASNIIFKIGDTDYSKYINETSYNVNREQLYEEWTDGNFVRHRIPTRKIIKGKMTLIFPPPYSVLFYFTRSIYNHTVDMKTKIVIYVPSENATDTIEAYITTNVKKHILVPNHGYIDIVELTVEEA